MSKYICPSCGASFNGKKCKNCAYESFSEEVAHNLHVHEGEPLVIHDTARKTVPYRDPFVCPPKPKKQVKQNPKKWILPVVVLALVYLLGMPVFYLPRLWKNFTSTSQEIISDTVPLDAVTLYRDDTIAVYGDLSEEAFADACIPLYITNHSKTDLYITTADVLVNSLNLDAFANLFEFLSPGQTLCVYLTFLEPGLSYAGIDEISQLSFRLCYESSGSQSEAAYTDTIVLGQTGSESMSQAVPDMPLLQEDGLSLYFLGLYRDPNAPESLEDAELIFCVENSTPRDMELFSQKILVNGNDSSLSLWANAPANCISFFPMYLYGIDLEDFSQLEELLVRLSAYDGQIDTGLGTAAIPIT